MFRGWIDKLGQLLWSDKPAKTGWQEKSVLIGRLCYRVGADFIAGDIALRAMSLVFTTLLAIVPLLAVSFSVLKGFGVHNQIEPLLLQLLEPMGEKGVEVTNNIIGFVENIKVGVLGSLGLALLFYSAFSLIQKVEQAFNSIWRLKQSRTLLRRITDYLSILVIGPVLIFTAIGLSATMMNNEVVQELLRIEPLGRLYRFFVRLVPYLLIVAAFTFFYVFIPNTRVKIRAAFIGGIVSGVIWQSTSWIFATVIVASTKYSAIYSGFATLIILMLWVNLNWLILLLGADLVYHIQHADNLSVPQHRLRLSITDRESIGLQILSIIGRAQYGGQPGVTLQDLIHLIRLPEVLLAAVVDLLKEAGLISECADPPGLLLPARPFDNTSVKEALDSLRGVPRHAGFSTENEINANVSRLLARADEALQESLGKVSLKQLALNRDEAG